MLKLQGVHKLFSNIIIPNVKILKIPNIIFPNFLGKLGEGERD
jgi:hypothetical protein